jgi:hypothetical protein
LTTFWSTYNKFFYGGFEVNIDEKAEKVKFWLYKNKRAMSQRCLAEKLGVNHGVLCTALNLDRSEDLLDRAIEYIEKVGV